MCAGGRGEERRGINEGQVREGEGKTREGREGGTGSERGQRGQDSCFGAEIKRRGRGEL